MNEIKISDKRYLDPFPGEKAHWLKFAMILLQLTVEMEICLVLIDFILSKILVQFFYLSVAKN